MSTEPSFYEKPFEHVLEHIRPVREKIRREIRKRYWWRLGETMPRLRNAINPLSRFIITPRVSKYRLLVWMDKVVLPDCATVVIARDDDTTFGILHSRFHELWSLRLCTWLGKGNDPRYTPTTTFETFPFPQGLTPNIPAKNYADNPHAQAIAKAAQRLDQLRNNWLNPPELVKGVSEVVEGYPDRLIPVDGNAAKELKNRTLTKLYNAKPQWLVYAHKAIDEAVARAYGWENNLSDDEVLARLLKLNLERSTQSCTKP